MDEELTPQVTSSKGRRRSNAVTAKAAVGVPERTWEEVVKDVHRLIAEGKTDPEISEELKMNPMFVKQVRTRSYQSTVNTKNTFERFEKARPKK